jgi:KipI family sensor histidine kinase inhibitor
MLFDTGYPPAWLAAAITAAQLPGVRDVVSGARTVLVITEPGSIPAKELSAVVGGLPVTEPEGSETRLVEIPVVYDGPDLADVAEFAQLSIDEVIERHSGGLYTVGWLGFAPGFGYLTGLDQRLAGVPRLATPRLAVPAGSVAIAAGLAAVYPSQSPGGWRLLGRTTVRTWDVDREPAALFAPGTRVRFIPGRASHTGPAAPVPKSLAEPKGTQAAATGSEVLSPQPPPTGLDSSTSHQPAPTGPQPHPPPPLTGPRIEVIRPGPFATVQDLGRPGAAAIGVPPSGAADSASLVAANRLVGNPDAAAGIELTLGRAVLRCFGGLRLAVTGAPATVTVEADQPGQPGQPALAASQSGPAADEVTVQVEFGSGFEVADGGLVSIGAPTSGLRTYIAVGGGLATPAVLGSRSVDVLSKLGGGALRPGNVLAVGSERRLESTRPPSGASPPPAASPPPTAAPPLAAPVIPARGAVARLRVIGGPRLDWFEPDALDALLGSTYTVSPASNRTGLRLTGPPLPRLTGRELPSEGMVTGSIEVPPDGQPILLLADHPTVGGYPVIAVVVSADVGLAAQLRPGDQISFAS